MILPTFFVSKFIFKNCKMLTSRFQWPVLQNFLGRNYGRIIVSWSVRYCQSLPPQSIICRQGTEPTSRVESRKGVKNSTLVASSIVCKYYTRYSMIDSSKHSSLLRRCNNYSCKRIMVQAVGKYSVWNISFCIGNMLRGEKGRQWSLKLKFNKTDKKV